MEVSGYTGWGLGLIIAVFGFNLVCLLAYFVLSGLRRSHDLKVLQIKTFLTLLDRERSRSKDEGGEALHSVTADLGRHLGKAEGLGPLWGRKHLSSALIVMGVISERFPELCEAIDQRMLVE